MIVSLQYSLGSFLLSYQHMPAEDVIPFPVLNQSQSKKKLTNLKTNAGEASNKIQHKPIEKLYN